MDEFNKDINIEIFRKWVFYYAQNHPELSIEEYDERTYKIYYKDKVGRFVVWPIGIVEEAIHQDKNVLFYLHYQFRSFNYALDLFYRFIDKLLEDGTREKSLLLCCTGGLTTSYFTEKLRTYCQLNHLSYKIDAIAYSQLKKQCSNYDYILIAPQLRYKLLEIGEYFDAGRIISIDSVTFATYNCQALINQVRSLEDYERHK